VDVSLNVDGRPYVLVDTAGVRRRGRVSEKLEKLSVLRALRSLEKCDVAFLTIDALEGLADQDAHIAGRAFERGRPVVFLLNKWDLIKDKKEAREAFTRELELKMAFLEKAPWLPVSALKGQGLKKLWPLLDRIMEQYTSRASTAEVNRVVNAAVLAHTPPYAGRGRLKFYYATQASTRPPSFVIFANKPEAVHYSYKRYLINRLKEAFKLDLIPARVFIRARREEHEDAPKKKAGPFRGKATKTGPKKTGSAKTGPAKARAAKTGAAKARPAKARPAKTGLTKERPVKARPAKAGPAKAGSAKTGPTKAGAAKARPAKAGATNAGATKAGATKASSQKSGPKKKK
jgi:small GTP-binding protein